MPPLLHHLTFEAFVRHLFDHEVAGPTWYFEPDAPYWSGPPEVTIDYVTRLLEDAAPVLAPYSDAKLNQGFWYLVSNGASDCMCALTDPRVPAAKRARCLSSFAPVFRDVFAPRCSPHLSHRDEPGAAPLNAACYMWWDLLPLAGDPADASRRALDRAALDAMTEILALDAIACRESALHGLGHWHAAYPSEVEAVVDRFLAEHPTARPELLAYARAARSGCVQ